MSVDGQPYFGTGKEGQILCLLLPCEYCMPQVKHFWYLHIHYSVLYSNKVYYDTKSHHKMTTLMMNWLFRPYPHLTLAFVAVCSFHMWVVFPMVQSH